MFAMFAASSPRPYHKVLEGRRIVELGLLAEKLGNGCSACFVRLHLDDCVGEEKYGLARVLEFECITCGCSTKISTSKTHFAKEKTQHCGRPAYDINTKSSLAVLSSGLGLTQVAKYLQAINVPPISLKSQKKREREIGPIVERVAKESCRAACGEERNLTLNVTEVPGASETTDINAGYDMGWTKRGRAMNSITDVGAMIGMNSGKVIAYGTRVKKYRICDHAKRTGTSAPDHDCCFSWSKS